MLWKADGNRTLTSAGTDTANPPLDSAFEAHLWAQEGGTLVQGMLYTFLMEAIQLKTLEWNRSQA